MWCLCGGLTPSDMKPVERSGLKCRDYAVWCISRLAYGPVAFGISIPSAVQITGAQNTNEQSTDEQFHSVKLPTPLSEEKPASQVLTKRIRPFIISFYAHLEKRWPIELKVGEPGNK